MSNLVDLIEPCKSGIEHASFNEAAAHSLARACGRKVRFWAAPSHLSGLQLESSAEPCPITVLGDGNKLRMVRKALSELWTLRRVLSLTATEDRALCVLSLTPLVLWLLTYCSFWLRARACVVLHNELEMTLDKKGQFPFSRGWFVANAIKRWQSNGPTVICLSRAGCEHIKYFCPHAPVSYASLPFINLKMLGAPHNKNDINTADLIPDLRYDWVIAGTLRDERLNASLRVFADALDQALKSCEVISRRRLLILGGRGLESETLRVLTSAKSIEVTFMRPEGSASYFNTLTRCSALVFLCTPDMYRVSASSVLVDGLSAGLPVYSLPCVYAVELSEAYPGRVVVEPDHCRLVNRLLIETFVTKPNHFLQSCEEKDIGTVVVTSITSKGTSS